MLSKRVRFILFALVISFAFAGCGFDAIQETVKLRLSFSVDEMTGAFAAEKDYRPDDNPDIKNNRDRLEDGTVQIRSLAITLTRIGANNAAKFAWGKVYATPKGTALGFNLEDDVSKPCAESSASACFEAIALVPTDTQGDRGGLSLDISPDQKAKLIDLVFNNPELTVTVVGWTDQKEKPVVFDADVVFSIDISANAL